MPTPTLQHFELHVLLAIVRHGGDAYSVPLVLALEQRTRRRISQAAVFIALRRLEKKGLVTSRLDGRQAGLGNVEDADRGRIRRYFAITKAGLAAVKEHREEHTRLWHGLSRLLRSPRS
jgi:PadR family transcriptional regulator, regulatory protein PadR